MGGSLPLLKGTLDLLLLQRLDVGPSHGYGLATWLEERSGGLLEVEDSALYQALHRMEGRGWVASEWGTTENNRRAKYYELTPEGREHLREERTIWTRYAHSVSDILADPAAGGGG